MNQTIVLIVVNVLAVVFVAAFAWWYGKRVSRPVPLGAATPQNPAVEGTGTRPASESGGISPCAAPPQDASRPNPEPWNIQFTGEPLGLHFPEATTHDNEVQP